MALSGWNENKKIRLSIPAQPTELVDFPLLVNIATDSGVTDFDNEDIFDELTPLVVDDDFTGTDGDAPDTRLWQTGHDIDGSYPGTGLVPVLNSNALRFTGAGSEDATKSISSSLYLLSGDFDGQVNFSLSHLITDSEAAGLLISSTPFDMTNDLFAMIGKYGVSGNLTEYRAYVHNDTETKVSSADISGKFRLVRSDSVLSFYTWTGVSWYLFKTAASYGIHDVYISVYGACWAGNVAFTASFDNFIVNSGAIVWPETPKKLAFEIGNTGVQTYCEIERWDYNAKSAQLWIAPTVGVSATFLNLYYDKDHTDNTYYIGDTGSAPAQEVWDDNFKAVYHMSQDPSTGGACILDSTSNANHGTPGGLSAGNMVQGDILTGLSFTGSQYITAPFSGAGGNITLEAVNSISTFSGERTLVSQGVGTTDTTLLLRYDDTSDLYWQHNNLTQTASGAINITNLTLDVELSLVAKDDNINSYVYADGVEEFSAPRGSLVSALATSPINIGRDNRVNRYFLGSLFEVRLSNIDRSVDWIVATNLSNTDALITFGIAYTFSGYVTVEGTPEERKVLMFNRSTYLLETSTMSVSGTGYFELTTTTSGVYFINILPELDDDYNILAYDKIDFTG